VQATINGSCDSFKVAAMELSKCEQFNTTFDRTWKREYFDYLIDLTVGFTQQST